MHVCLSAHTVDACRSSGSWEMALEVKWPVEPYLQPEPLRKKRKCELLNKRPLLCTNSIHPSFLAEWLFNCPHLDALTLVLSTAMSVLAQLWRGDKGCKHTNRPWWCETHTHMQTRISVLKHCRYPSPAAWKAQWVVVWQHLCSAHPFRVSFIRDSVTKQSKTFSNAELPRLHSHD